jgi:hypothetical protein
MEHICSRVYVRHTLTDRSRRVRAHFFRNLLFYLSFLVVSSLSGEYIILKTVYQTQSALLQAEKNMKSTRKYIICLEMKEIPQNGQEGTVA